MSYNKNHAQWLQKCRAILIDMETKNIRQRALSWTEIVNAETTKINSMLGINLNDYRMQQQQQQQQLHGQHGGGDLDYSYQYIVSEPLKYLTFLSEWSGIKTRNTSSQPTSYTEFEQKAKNWLNGRRAPNYGNTLFPDMIKTSEQYSKRLADVIFGNIPINKLSQSPTSDALSNQYQKTLLFAYLHKLCTERIAVHQSWKKTNLLCENSVKNIHSNTAKLLQQYAIHDYTANDLNSFPGSLQRSAAFFQDQHNAYLSRLIHSYNIFKNGTTSHTNTRSTPSITTYDQRYNHHHHTHNNQNDGNHINYLHHNHNHPTNTKNNNVVNRGNVNMVNGRNDAQSVNYVAIKSSDYAQIMQRLAALERKHNSQAEQISTLTNKCQLLQAHIESNSATSRISSISGGTAHHQYDKLSSNEEYYNDQSVSCSIQNNPVPSNSNHPNHTSNVIGITSSPSISHHSADGTNSTVNTGSSGHHSNHLQLPNISRPSTATTSASSALGSVTAASLRPIPFNISDKATASHSLPPQLSLPTFNSSNTVIVSAANHNDRKLELSYNAPPALTTLTTSTSMPAIYNLNHSNTNTANSTPRSTNNPGIGGYNPFEYGLNGLPYSMYSEPNNNQNEHKYNNPHHHQHGVHENDTNHNNNDCTMNYLTSSTPNTSGNNLSLLNNSSYLSDAMMLDQTSTPNTNQLFAFSPINH